MLCYNEGRKKLIRPAGQRGPAGESQNHLFSPNKGNLRACLTFGNGTAILEQIWNAYGTRGLSMHSPSSVSILAGRAFFLAPKEWSWCYLPFKIAMQGGVMVIVGLQRAGLIAGLAIMKEGHLCLNVGNGTESVIHLTPKTVMVNVFAEPISVKCLGKDTKLVSHVGVCEQKFSDKMKDKVVTQYPEVGDFSTHPVNDEMAKLIIKASEVS